MVARNKPKRFHPYIELLRKDIPLPDTYGKKSMEKLEAGAKKLPKNKAGPTRSPFKELKVPEKKGRSDA